MIILFKKNSIDKHKKDTNLKKNNSQFSVELRTCRTYGISNYQGIRTYSKQLLVGINNIDHKNCK